MANRFWVGGAGIWDNSNTTHWSATSGGSGGATVPTSADVVVFDASSGAGIVILGFDAPCLTLNLSAFTGTLAFGTNKITVAGNAATIFTGSSSYSVTGTPVIESVYAGSTGTRTITTGTGVTEANSISFKFSAGAGSVAVTTNAILKSLDFTGFTGTLTNTAVTLYGNFTLGSGMTVTTGGGTYTFAATSGIQTITSNSVIFSKPIATNSPSASTKLIDNFTCSGVTLTAGTLDLNNQTLSAATFSSNNSNTRSIAFGTGNITLTGNAATIWTTSTATGLTVTGTPIVNCTYAGSTGTRTCAISITSAGGTESNAITFNFTAGSDIVAFSNNSTVKNLNFTGFTGTWNTTTRTIYGDLTLNIGMTLPAGTSVTTFGATSGTKTITTAGLTLDCPITFNGIGGTWSFADALTQGSTRAFTITNGTVKLKAGATSTVGAFATSGTNQKYLQSTTAGSQATLSQASGTVTVSYLTIKDIAATGGATWNAYVDYNNVDQGDNTGWDFSNSPAIDNEFPIALRSFTQPKRF